uniref:Uncharacterized protein n=1 Tax=Cacopsylla melanoneura TaxID=428564 RepID=A0A8D8YA83_9HEMI
MVCDRPWPTTKRHEGIHYDGAEGRQRDEIPSSTAQRVHSAERQSSILRPRAGQGAVHRTVPAGYGNPAIPAGRPLLIYQTKVCHRPGSALTGHGQAYLELEGCNVRSNEGGHPAVL